MTSHVVDHPLHTMQRMMLPLEEAPPAVPSEGERATRALALGMVLGMFLALAAWGHHADR